MKDRFYVIPYGEGWSLKDKDLPLTAEMANLPKLAGWTGPLVERLVGLLNRVYWED